MKGPRGPEPPPRASPAEGDAAARGPIGNALPIENEDGQVGGELDLDENGLHTLST